MKNDLLTNLENLSPEELAKVANLITKLSNKEEPIRRKRGGRGGKGKGKKRIIMPDDQDFDLDEKPQRTRSNKRKGRGGRKKDFDLKEHRRQRSMGRGNTDVPSRRESMVIDKNRPNYFEEMEENSRGSRKERSDQQKLTGGKRPTKRKPTRLIEVECSECGYDFNVTPSVIHKRDGEIRYVCDDCIRDKG